MPPKKYTPVTPKDVAIYLVEADESGVVPEDTIKLVRHCVMDKIFSENQDHIAICRTDMTSNVQFDPANWNALRKVETKFREPRESKNDPISALTDMCSIISNQAREDSYVFQKILFFALLKADLKGDKLEKLAAVLKRTRVSVSIILPDEDGMDATQLENSKSLRKFLESEEYEEYVYVCTAAVARKQIFNTLNKPPKRSSAWNVNLEIGASIQISVSGYVCSRKNTQTELKKALLKEERQIPGSQNITSKELVLASNSSMEYEGASNDQKTVVRVELASNVMDKETAWKEKDGTIVNENDMGKAYFYGDKLIPFNEIENGDIYKSGEKCLRVIVFSPKNNIFPAFQIGDGTTLFYAKKGDSISEAKLSALVQAMHNRERIAIVRKVYRKDSRVNLGIMSPDVDRKCLVYSEICFADDISVPHFATLLKEESASEEDDGHALSAKEQLIDDLILSQTLDGFHPFEGPIDPAAASLRNNISFRILDPKAITTSCADDKDNIEIFFNKLVLQDQVEALQNCFPLQIIQQQADRPAGASIFRKRPLEAIQDGKVEKKLKTEDVEQEDKIVPIDDNNDVDYDDLLDQM